jgi:hypothetical protein
MSKLKIATLHCMGSNPNKHATQHYHFKHCAAATAALADWTYPAGPHLLDREVVYNLLKTEMGCSDDEVEAFGFEEPRAWFRFTGGEYVGLAESMDYLAEYCRRERPDGIAGYSNGGGAALLVAASAEAGHEAFRSIRFVMSFAGGTSPTMQRHISDILGATRSRIAMPAILCGSRHDPMLVNADQMARDLFERCELAVVDEKRPFANHALPDRAEDYDAVVRFLQAR